MAEIEFIDQTLRDGQQSLWGMRMRAGMATAVTDHFNRAGFHTVDLTGGAFFEVMMRYSREDPWEGLDWLRQRMPNVKLRSGRRTTAFGKFGFAPPAIVDLWIQTLVKHGIDSFWIYDCLYNMDAMERVCRAVVDAGAEVIPAIMYGISPVHTDAYFAERVRQMASWGIASAIYVEDAPGILVPERASTLIPAIVEAAGSLPVEVHCHNTTGLAPLNYIEAIKHGVRIIHTASRPLANGPSLPSTEMMVHNLDWLGHTHHLDTEVFEPIATHFTRVADQEGFPLGVPNEYDVGTYRHQMPGGMTGTLKAQLAEHHLEDRLHEVLHEVASVREELGHPISATPFSQFMGTQAVLNVTTGERYSVIPDELIIYVLGHYGQPPVPIDENVKDRILSAPNAKALAGWVPPDKSLREIRQDYGGPAVSDEELLLRYLVPNQQYQAMRSAGPFQRDYPLHGDTKISDLVDKILNSHRVGHVHLELGCTSLSLQNHAI